MESITYYAIAGDASGNSYSTTVNSLTIYRLRRRSGYIMAKSPSAIIEALDYALRVSSRDYPVKIFVPDGTYTLSQTAEVGNWVSLIGESREHTIIRSSAADGALLITGDYAYIQDITLGSTLANGIAFRDNATYDHTTLHIGLEEGDKYTFNHGTSGTRTSAPIWNPATDDTQAHVESFTVNGNTVSVTSAATPNYLIEVWNGTDWDYTMIDNANFYVLSSLSDKTIQLRAANRRGAFGPACTTMTRIVANGEPYEAVSVTLNSAGFASFSYDDANAPQLQVSGASAYRAIYNKDENVIKLSHLNDQDIIPSGVGVILFGMPGSKISFSLANDPSVNSTPYADVTTPLYALKGNGNETIKRTAGDNKFYFGLSGNEFRKLSETGTIKPNKAYFDLTETNTDYGAAAIRMIFESWPMLDEEETSAITDLTSAKNETQHNYSLTGAKTRQQQGLYVRDGKVVLVK